MFVLLAKNELPHTTKFATLLDLAINLGCDYIRNYVEEVKPPTGRSRQCLNSFSPFRIVSSKISLQRCIRVPPSA